MKHARGCAKTTLCMRSIVSCHFAAHTNTINSCVIICGLSCRREVSVQVACLCNQPCTPTELKLADSGVLMRCVASCARRLENRDIVNNKLCTGSGERTKPFCFSCSPSVFKSLPPAVQVGFHCSATKSFMLRKNRSQSV